MIVVAAVFIFIADTNTECFEHLLLLMLPGVQQFEDGKWYTFEVLVDEIENEEETNCLLYRCLYADGDNEDMYWISQEQNIETQGLLDVLDWQVLDRIAPLMTKYKPQKKSNGGGGG